MRLRDTIDFYYRFSCLMSTMTMTAFDTRLSYYILNCASLLISSFIFSMFDSAFTSFLDWTENLHRAFAKRRHTGSSSCAELIRRHRNGIEQESKVESVLSPSCSLNKFIVQHISAWICEISSFARQSSSAFSSRGVIVPVDGNNVVLPSIKPPRSFRLCVCLSLCLCSTKRSMYSIKTSKR